MRMTAYVLYTLFKGKPFKSQLYLVLIILILLLLFGKKLQ